jgi:hypothetical protein
MAGVQSIIGPFMSAAVAIGAGILGTMSCTVRSPPMRLL